MLDPLKRLVPRHRMPPLNALRAFDATARHLTVVRAADELNVTPSAVSHQLRTLEDALGVQLFTRIGTRLKLSLHGEALLPSIRSAFQMIAAGTARLEAPLVMGRLVVSAPPGFASRVITRHIGEFLLQYPDVDFQLIASNEDKEVFQSSVDLCIRYGNGLWADRRTQLLAFLDQFPVCSPAWLQRRPALLSVEDLRGYPLLCEDAGSEWTRWLLSAGAADDASGFRLTGMGNSHMAIDAAVHGQGIALANVLLVGDDLAEGRLVRLFAGSLPARHAYYTVCRHEAHAHPVVAAFVEWISARVRRYS